MISFSDRTGTKWMHEETIRETEINHKWIKESLRLMVIVLSRAVFVTLSHIFLFWDGLRDNNH